jgi:calmodulin
MGYIGAAHLKHIMTSIGDKLSAESAEQLIKDADTDKDGKIDYAAFVKVLLS